MFIHPINSPLQSDIAKLEYSNTSTRSESYGCAYLQAIQAQLDTYPTTGGEYLEAIFTHREILLSYPQAHQECARGFSDLAYMLEQRAWRADRDADVEAVVAFRYEAWSIVATMWVSISAGRENQTDITHVPLGHTIRMRQRRKQHLSALALFQQNQHQFASCNQRGDGSYGCRTRNQSTLFK